MSKRRRLAWFFLTGLVASSTAAPAAAQSIPADLAAERRGYATWLAEAPTSPLRAVAHAAIGRRLTLGPPDADLPLPDAPWAVLTERNGSLALTVRDVSHSMVRDRPATLGSYRIVAAGPPTRTTVTAYRAEANPALAPTYFPYTATWRHEVVLERPAQSGIIRMLAVDGAEIEARRAGTVLVTAGDTAARLLVVELPARGSAPTELVIFFRDATGGHGSYPAGRFVTLQPLATGRFLLDFNRSRNPFCAYNPVLPCPAPVRGNTIPAPVSAGERYTESAARGG